MRPTIIAHMCTSIDGRTLGGRWGRFPGQKPGENLFEVTALEFGIGAWFVGTTTMKEFADGSFKLPKAKERLPRTDFIARTDTKRLAIGADRHAVLRWKKNEVEGDHVVMIITERASNDYIAHLRAAGCSYLFCGKTDIDLKLAVEKIGKAFKLKKLMVHGGGTFNGSMLAAGLIDEVSQVIVPVIDGAKVTGIFDTPGKNPPAAAILKVKSLKKLPAGVHWVQYKVVGKPQLNR